MELLIVVCEKLWILMVFVAFFVCLAKGWLKKGFYLTSDQAREAESREEQKQEQKKKNIRKYAGLMCKKKEASEK